MIKVKINISLKDLALLLSQKEMVWLDTAQSKTSKEHTYSILAYDPIDTKTFFSFSDSHSFRTFLESFSFQKNNINDNFCFNGGWLGYISYEAYAYNKTIPLTPQNKKDYPLAIFKKFDSFFYENKNNGDVFFVSYSLKANEKYKELLNIIKSNNPLSGDFSVSKTTPHTTKDEYKTSFNKVKEALKKGDYFELNLTQEFYSCCHGNPLPLYQKLREHLNAPMMAYINFKEICILSASPERFFHIKNKKITMFPIKGTIKRGKSIEEDSFNKNQLLQSEKDKAELLMITDLLRNDLGRISKTGSVTVDELFSLHTFSYYHHLISKISGVLKEKTNLLQVFDALYPCGSITGAPKIQVISHTDEIENRARGVYTGAVGLIGLNGFIDFNIPIRTITIHNNHLCFASGGGIVSDSKLKNEFDECLLKTMGITKALHFFYKKDLKSCA